MNVVAIILGGGQGKRLYPLTLYRSKPAVPIGGKYRLVDIPISNSLHSGVGRIFVLTQFNSASLNNHIHNTYRFDHFSQSAVILLSAEQTLSNSKWFQGTADAVRCHFSHYHLQKDDDVLVLSGDHLYRMDYQKIISFHRENNADVTLSTILVDEKMTPGFGILKMEKGGLITDFVEKPKTHGERSGYAVTAKNEYLASMGVYVFKASVLEDLLNGPELDFGKELIPKAIKTYKTFGYLFHGYWRDIGTIESFFAANLELIGPYPKFRFHSPKGNVFTHPRFLPPSQLLESKVDNCLLSEGSVIRGAQIANSVIGLRSIINKKTRVENSIMMGADFYEFETRITNRVPLGIGEDSHISNAILDKNVRIGRNVKILNKKKLHEFDGDSYFIREGIVIIPKGAVINDGTEI